MPLVAVFKAQVQIWSGEVAGKTTMRQIRDQITKFAITEFRVRGCGQEDRVVHIGNRVCDIASRAGNLELNIKCKRMPVRPAVDHPALKKQRGVNSPSGNRRCTPTLAECTGLVQSDKDPITPIEKALQTQLVDMREEVLALRCLVESAFNEPLSYRWLSSALALNDSFFNSVGAPVASSKWRHYVFGIALVAEAHDDAEHVHAEAHCLALHEAERSMRDVFDFQASAADLHIAKLHILKVTNLRSPGALELLQLPRPSEAADGDVRMPMTGKTKGVRVSKQRNLAWEETM